MSKSYLAKRDGSCKSFLYKVWTKSFGHKKLWYYFRGDNDKQKSDAKMKHKPLIACFPPMIGNPLSKNRKYKVGDNEHGIREIRTTR